MKLLLKGSRCYLIAAFGLLPVMTARADDWPQFRGLNRDAVWKEARILQSFPPEGLKIRWRATVGYGLSSPVVAQGRVYLIDSDLQKPQARERLHCFDEKTGQPLWLYAYEVNYPEWAFDPTQQSGPNSTPLVHDGRIYALGATGQLVCLEAAIGTLVWKRNLMKDYGMKEFTGTTPSPLIEGDLLIAVVGCQPDASVIAFDRNSGKEVWKALDDPATYSSPIVINAGGKRQLIVWTPKAVTSLNPSTGETWWREELNTGGDYGVATPVFDADLLLISGLMFQLNSDKPAASVIWPETKPMSKRILSQTSMPLMKDGYLYSGKSSGEFVCLEARTGKQIWQTDKVTGVRNGASIHLTPNGNSVLIFTDQGNLIRARLSGEAYTEISRVHLVDPTYPFGGRKLVWPPPAYANRHVLVPNGAELISAPLAAEP